MSDKLYSGQIENYQAIMQVLARVLQELRSGSIWRARADDGSMWLFTRGQDEDENEARSVQRRQVLACLVLSGVARALCFCMINRHRGYREVVITKYAVALMACLLCGLSSSLDLICSCLDTKVTNGQDIYIFRKLR